MDRSIFENFISKNERTIEAISKSAWDLHNQVNQTYGGRLPYGYHLSMVADAVLKYGYNVIMCEDDILPVVFGAYYHDSIEDARQTYNDVKKKALEFMSPSQALMATEIVYALTNDKGRTRTERAGEHYYQGIRNTPYAPMVKLADRLANITCSANGRDDVNKRMRKIYLEEWPHFLESITVNSEDKRFSLPQQMIENIKNILAIQIV